jgi:hypothetical protein
LREDVHAKMNSWESTLKKRNMERNCLFCRNMKGIPWKFWNEESKKGMKKGMHNLVFQKLLLEK